MKRPTMPFALATLALLGACEATTLTEPEAPLLAEDPLASTLSAAAEGRGEGGGGSLFDELASEIAGFGGLYRDGPCSVVVVLTDMTEEKHALQVVHATLAPLVAKPCPGGVQVSAEQGEFTYLELQGFLAASRPLLEIDGVRGVRVDYQLNRLVVAVVSRRVAQSVLEALPGLGIPASAVAFETGGGTSHQGRGSRGG